MNTKQVIFGKKSPKIAIFMAVCGLIMSVGLFFGQNKITAQELQPVEYQPVNLFPVEKYLDEKCIETEIPYDFENEKKTYEANDERP